MAVGGGADCLTVSDTRVVHHRPAWANAAATPATTAEPSWALGRTGPHSNNWAIVHVLQPMQSHYIR